MKRVMDRFYDVVMVFCKILLLTETLIVCWDVLARYVWRSSPVWTEDIVLTCMIYMALISGALAIRRNAHIRMTAFDKLLPPRALAALDLLADIAVTAFALLMIIEGGKYALNVKGYFTSIPTLSKTWRFLPVPIAGVCMLVFEIEKMIEHGKILFGKALPEKVNEKEEVQS